jgi:hypothetical protein
MCRHNTILPYPFKRGEQNFLSTWTPAVNTPYTERVKRCAIIGYSQGKINYTQCHLPIANKCISCFNRFKGEAREVIGHLRNEPVTGSDTWTADNIKLSVCTRGLYTYNGTGAYRQTVRLLLFLFKKIKRKEINDGNSNA